MTVSHVTAVNPEDTASCRGDLPGDTRFFGGKTCFPCCRWVISPGAEMLKQQGLFFWAVQEEKSSLMFFLLGLPIFLIFIPIFLGLNAQLQGPGVGMFGNSCMCWAHSKDHTGLKEICASLLLPMEKCLGSSLIHLCPALFVVLNCDSPCKISWK